MYVLYTLCSIIATLYTVLQMSFLSIWSKVRVWGCHLCQNQNLCGIISSVGILWNILRVTVLLPSFLDPACLSIACTPTILGSMDSSPSDKSARVCFGGVRPSVLQLKLNGITQWLISHRTLYCSLTPRTVFVCPSYAHPQIVSLWTLPPQMSAKVCFRSVRLSVLHCRCCIIECYSHTKQL